VIYDFTPVGITALKGFTPLSRDSSTFAARLEVATEILAWSGEVDPFRTEQRLAAGYAPHVHGTSVDGPVLLATTPLARTGRSCH